MWPLDSTSNLKHANRNQMIMNIVFLWLSATTTFSHYCTNLIGGTENAVVETAGVEKLRADRRGGKCRTGVIMH